MTSVYLDHAATTPMRDEVRAAMEPYLSDTFGNPSSVHRWGREASNALEDARERVARCLGAASDEIRFVRGGTESDNLAVLGRADLARRSGRRPLVAVSQIEHRAVLEAAEAVEEDGGEVVRVPVGPDGTPDAGALDACLVRRPDVVSVMWVNNEIGIRLPVEQVAERCRAAGVAMHSDAVQAVGTLPVRVDEVPVTLLTATGHKLGGPRSTGILFVRSGTELRPRLFGGGQERRLRPGTEDVAGAVGMAEALERAVDERAETADRLVRLRDRMEAALREGIPGLRVRGEEATRAPHLLHVGVPEVDVETLLVGLDLAGVAASSGSACSSGARQRSHVLDALYGESVRDLAPLRFSFGRETTEEDVDRAADATVRLVRRARETDGAPLAGGVA